MKWQLFIFLSLIKSYSCLAQNQNTYPVTDFHQQYAWPSECHTTTSTNGYLNKTVLPTAQPGINGTNLVFSGANRYAVFHLTGGKSPQNTPNGIWVAKDGDYMNDNSSSSIQNNCDSVVFNVPNPNYKFLTQTKPLPLNQTHPHSILSVKEYLEGTNPNDNNYIKTCEPISLSHNGPYANFPLTTFSAVNETKKYYNREYQNNSCIYTYETVGGGAANYVCSANHLIRVYSGLVADNAPQEYKDAVKNAIRLLYCNEAVATPGLGTFPAMYGQLDSELHSCGPSIGNNFWPNDTINFQSGEHLENIRHACSLIPKYVATPSMFSVEKEALYVGTKGNQPPLWKKVNCAKYNHTTGETNGLGFTLKRTTNPKANTNPLIMSTLKAKDDVNNYYLYFEPIGSGCVLNNVAGIKYDKGWSNPANESIDEFFDQN